MSTVTEHYKKKLEILLLCDYKSHGASTIVDHIFGIQKHSRHNVRVLKNIGALPDKLELERFDAVIIHYSITCCSDYNLHPSARLRLRNFKGLKAVFIQDEYRFIDATVEALAFMKIDVLFSVVPQDIIDQVYDPQKLPCRKVTLLTGYVPEQLLGRQLPPIKDRPIDVGYRARKLPEWLGVFAMEKWEIAERFKEDAKKFNLICDLSNKEGERLYGKDWINFLANCKSTLGTESGASVCDFSGSIQKDTEAFKASHPDASFKEIQQRFFEDVDGKIVIAVISPRIFEAIALKTLLILYEGKYSDIVMPWKHYVPLKKDHSNIKEVVQVLRDHVRAQEIVDCAYNEIACNPENSFASMVRKVDEVIEELFKPSMVAPLAPYDDISFHPIKKEEKLRDIKYSFAVRLAYFVNLILRLFPEHIRKNLQAKLQYWWRTSFFHFIVSGADCLAFLSRIFRFFTSFSAIAFRHLLQCDQKFFSRMREIKKLFSLLFNVVKSNTKKSVGLLNLSQKSFTLTVLTPEKGVSPGWTLLPSSSLQDYLGEKRKNNFSLYFEEAGYRVDFPNISYLLNKNVKGTYFTFISDLLDSGVLLKAYCTDPPERNTLSSSSS